MSYLSNKKILLFAPAFHNIHHIIEKTMVNAGAQVDYFDERCGNNFITKFIIRIRLRFFLTKKINQYYSNILSKTKDTKYDFIFFINIETVSSQILKQFQAQHPNSTFILYMWDSLSLKPLSNPILNFFDKKYTFDMADSKKYNMTFLNLFYSEQYLGNQKTPIKYDICFIGTIHGDRVKVLKKIQNHANKHNLKFFCYMYIPSRGVFLLKKLLDFKFNLKYREVNFNSLDASQVSVIMSQSKSILDLPHKNQVGFSMRTFETLGMQKKLISTNPKIKEQIFYDPQNIQIIDRHDICLNRSFIDSKYKKTPDDLLQKYSLDSWLKKIFIE